MTREELHSILVQKIVKIVFTKVDGSTREMMCTLKKELLPIVEATEEKPSKPRKQNPDVMPVWDLEKLSWRSFRIDSVKSVDGVPE